MEKSCNTCKFYTIPYDEKRGECYSCTNSSGFPSNWEAREDFCETCKHDLNLSPLRKPCEECKVIWDDPYNDNNDELKSFWEVKLEVEKQEEKPMKTKIKMCCETCKYESKQDTGSPFASPCRECYEANVPGDDETYFLFWGPQEGESFFNLKAVQKFVSEKKERSRAHVIKSCDHIIKTLLTYLENDPEIKSYDYVMNATSNVIAVVNELVFRGFEVKVSDPIKTYSSEEVRGDDNVVLTITGW